MPRKPSASQQVIRPSANPSLSTLWQAIETAALERGHRPSDIARFAGLHAAHFYRIRKAPHQIARCHPDVLKRFAQYIDWTVLDVYLGSGLIDPSDLWDCPASAEVLRDALAKVLRSQFASGLVTPIEAAAPDHQLLVARLHAALLAAVMG